MNKGKFSVDFTEQDLEDLLKSCVSKAPNPELLVKALMGIASNDSDNFQLMLKAVLNIEPESKYYIGEVVLVRIDGISDYRFNKSLMEEKQMIIDNKIKATITNINMFRRYPYGLEYLYISKHDEHNNMTKHYELVHPSYIESLEEFPENLL